MSARSSPPRRARELATRRLSSRITLLALGLLLVVQAAGFVLVRQAIESNARRQIADELAFDERMWSDLLQQNADGLRRVGAEVAAGPAFVRAIGRGDARGIADALRSAGGPQGLGIAAWFDPELDLRAFDAGAAAEGGAAARETVLRDVAGMLAADDPEGSRLALLDGVPYQFVLLRVRPPSEPGWVLAGAALNSALVERFAGLMGGQLALLTQMPGGPLRLAQTTLPARYDRALLAGGPALRELRTDDDGRLLARRMRMPVAWGQADTLLLRSTEPVVRPFRRLQALLGGVALLGVALFGVGMAWMARRVTTPLRAVIAATERIGRGDYAAAPPEAYAARPDEVGELARALDRMRLSIAAQRAEMRDLAYRDRLTGLPNRLRLREALEQAIAARRAGPGAPPPRPVAVLTLDLDRFKHVNDVLGYAFGDRLLVAVAERLAQSLRGPGEMVARIGGNGFALLLRDADAAAALARARGLLQAFEAPVAFAGQTVDLSAAIGAACWPEHADEADLLLGRSEVAMYAAKRSTAGALPYAPSMEPADGPTLSLLTELRQALEHDELRLYLQPQIDLRSGRVAGAEALLRWQHPRRGLLPPMEFIPFAERTGFVRRITAWVLEAAARHWHGMQPARGAPGADGAPPPPPVRIAVNLSVRDLLDLEMPQRVADLLARHAVPADGLCLEITESAMMDDPQRTEAILGRLAALGLRLSIDDFGTGYSSLAYLKRLPVHELKIDRSFVIGMQSGADDATIVRSTIDLAHNLGLQVVAEGVEDAVLYRRLLGLDCDEAQGYHIGRPMPAGDFAAWHARWKAAAAGDAPA